MIATCARLSTRVFSSSQIFVRLIVRIDANGTKKETHGRIVILSRSQEGASSIVPDMSFDVIVIGGGHNGLVCATYLAKAGASVLVLEARPIVGGACVSEELFPGFSFSTCAYLCYFLQDKVVEDLELRKFGFEIFPIDPYHFVPFRDGRYVLTWRDFESTCKEIRKVSAEDESGYRRWAKFWRKAAGLYYPFFMRTPPTSEEILHFAKNTNSEDILEKLMTSSMSELVDEFFHDEQLKGYFVNLGQDLGDPDAIGGPVSMAYQYCSKFTSPSNVGIVKGGMGAITKAIASSARSVGAQIRTGLEVSNVIVRDGHAVGVRLRSGESLFSRAVVSNADPKKTFLSLVGPDCLDRQFVSSILELRTSVSSFKFHASLRRLPRFSHHFKDGSQQPSMGVTWIAPSVDYVRNCWRDIREKRVPSLPIMEVQTPTTYDSSLAPQGMQTFSVWCPYVPPQLKDGTWHDEKLVERQAEIIVENLSEYLPDLPGEIMNSKLLTPLDIEEKIGLTDGNIRHIDMIPSQLSSSRPLPGWSSYRTPIEGLFLCGAGTHPGGEVTGAPGHNAAQVVLSFLSQM